MNLFPLALVASVALAACTKSETPVAPTTTTPAAQTATQAPAEVTQPAPVVAPTPASVTLSKAAEQQQAQPAAVVQAPQPLQFEQAGPPKIADNCETIATSKEGRVAVLRFAEPDLKGIIARKAMETFPVPARLQMASLLSSGEIKVAENYELVYTPVAAELIRETDKGIVCRVSTEFHADGIITYSGEGNDGTTVVKEAPAKLDAKRDLYLKTTRRLDGRTQIEVVGL